MAQVKTQIRDLKLLFPKWFATLLEFQFLNLHRRLFRKGNNSKLQKGQYFSASCCQQTIHLRIIECLKSFVISLFILILKLVTIGNRLVHKSLTEVFRLTGGQLLSDSRNFNRVLKWKRKTFKSTS